MALNFNTNPYYDDFDEDKNFHRILFRPGRAVQARELTQSQTILQNQIDRFGKHIFQEGSKVTGAETFDEDDNENDLYDYITTVHAIETSFPRIPTGESTLTTTQE